MLYSGNIESNLESIRKQIEETCLQSARDPSEVGLIAVSKLQPSSAIQKAYDLGVRDFGENYVQELERKRTELAHLKDIRWHLIGPLQSNKVKVALPLADIFHALDSEHLLFEITKRHAQSGLQKPWPVFIQVNIDRESSKSGIDPSQVVEFVTKARQHPQVRVLGLMCLPEMRDHSEMRVTFRKMKELARSIEEDSPLHLSMGMSEDFTVAIEEGANWIRVGRGIFGDRQVMK